MRLLPLPLTSSCILRAPIALPLVLAHALACALINVHACLCAQNSLSQRTTQRAQQRLRVYCISGGNDPFQHTHTGAQICLAHALKAIHSRQITRATLSIRQPCLQQAIAQVQHASVRAVHGWKIPVLKSRVQKVVGA